MQLTNNEERFGLFTKLLHWSIFLLFVVQYYLVYRREYFSKEMPEKLQYILLHKSLGVVVLCLAFLMIFWSHLGKRPLPPKASKFKILISKVVHIFLYLSMLVMPLSGIFMSVLSGRAVSVFDWFKIPLFLAENKALAEKIYYVHLYASYVVICLVSLHVLGALYNHFIAKNDVLIRMTRG